MGCFFLVILRHVVTQRWQPEIATCCPIEQDENWRFVWKRLKFVFGVGSFLNTVLSIVVWLLVYWLVEYGWYCVGCYSLSCCVWEPLLHENLLLITPCGDANWIVIVTKGQHPVDGGVVCTRADSGLLLLLCVCLCISVDVSELKLLQGFPLF